MFVIYNFNEGGGAMPFCGSNCMMVMMGFFLAVGMSCLLYCSAYIHFSNAISSVVKMINIQEYMRCNFFDLKGTEIDHIYICVCLLYVCIFQMHKQSQIVSND